MASPTSPKRIATITATTMRIMTFRQFVFFLSCNSPKYPVSDT